ncbi:MAG: efflux RND transporter periplasmic adaptor subunit [Aureliella sp.]
MIESKSYPTIWYFFSKYCCLTAALLAVAGCGSADTITGEVKQKPRPIDVMVLTSQQPPTGVRVSAAASSWKTEQIGFEVAGRVEWVIEPGEEIEARIVGLELQDDVLPNADMVPGLEERISGWSAGVGTPIARLEKDRFELAVASADASKKKASKSVKAVEIELMQGLEAQAAAAEAELNLASVELDRSERLVKQNAGAQADVDRDKANKENAQSKVAQIEANKEAKKAELEMSRLEVVQAEQALKDASRDLNNCTLFSSFRGQVAETHVVPGSMVSAGQPVATVQLMDPIKIEVEVSAADSRRLKNRQRLSTLVTMPDGSIEERDAYLYLIDPVADPQTRTFTLTLLMLNERSSNAIEGIPATDQMWRVDFKFLPGSETGRLHAPEQAIDRDEEGSFLWMIESIQAGENLPKDGLVSVRKVRIELGKNRIPFLGNWMFQEIELKDPDFDPAKNLIAGQIEFQTGLSSEDWDGRQLMVDRGAQWLVRPGDVVRVDLSDGDVSDGIFLPYDAIVRESNESYIFIVEESENETVVRKRKVQLDQSSDQISSLAKVDPSDAQDLEGVTIAVRGVHYLRDGESVRVTQSEATR